MVTARFCESLKVLCLADGLLRVDGAGGLAAGGGGGLVDVLLQLTGSGSRSVEVSAGIDRCIGESVRCELLDEAIVWAATHPAPSVLAHPGLSAPRVAADMQEATSEPTEAVVCKRPEADTAACSPMLKAVEAPATAVARAAPSAPLVAALATANKFPEDPLESAPSSAAADAGDLRRNESRRMAHGSRLTSLRFLLAGERMRFTFRDVWVCGIPRARRMRARESRRTRVHRAGTAEVRARSRLAGHEKNLSFSQALVDVVPCRGLGHHR